MKAIVLTFVLYSIFFPSDGIFIQKASIKNNRLTICFCNHTDHKVIVPPISYRVGLKNTKFLFPNYYEIQHDTLVLKLHTEIDSALSDVRYSDHGVVNEYPNMTYIDTTLRSHQCFTDHVLIKDDLSGIKFLIVNYNKESYNYTFKRRLRKNKLH